MGQGLACAGQCKGNRAVVQPARVAMLLACCTSLFPGSQRGDKEGWASVRQQLGILRKQQALVSKVHVCITAHTFSLHEQEHTALPAPAVVGIDHVTRSHQPFGDFYRPLAPGSYGVLVTREGCQPFSTNITVPEDGSGAVLDVILIAQPGGGGEAEGGVAGSGDGGGSGSGSGSSGGGSSSSGEGVGGGHRSGVEPEVQQQEGEKVGRAGSAGEQAAKGAGEVAAAAGQPDAAASQGGVGVVDAAPGADGEEEVEEMLKLWKGAEQRQQQEAATARQAAEQQQQPPSAALQGGAAGSSGGVQSSLLWGARMGQGQESSSWLGQPLLLAAVGVFAIWVANSRLRRRGQSDRLRGD